MNENTLVQTHQDGLTWTVLPDARAVAEAACGRILGAARRAIAARGRFRIVLAGGSTPAATYRLLVEQGSDWTHWQVYFGDERCLPPGDPQRNSAMAAETLLDHVSIPADAVHPIPAGQGPEVAAQLYQEVVETAVPFDLVLLGMGEDGHTASLFPDHVYREQQWTCAIYDAPKPPARRVSLCAGALAETRGLLFLITGEGKRNAVRAWRSGADLPVASVRPTTGGEVLIDQAAMPDASASI